MTLSSQEHAATLETRRAERLAQEALAIIEAAQRNGARLRLTGGLAVRRYATDLDFMDREFSDIDFIGLSRESARLQRAFDGLGYEQDRHVAQATGGAQLQYARRARLLESHDHLLERPRPLAAANVGLPVADHIDVFLDVMRMDHDVDVRSRLDIDPVAISPADILLTKLQMGELAEKDVHDIVALLKDVPLGETDDNAGIDVRRLAGACAQDWGLAFDVNASLETVVALLAGFALPEAERTRVSERVTALRAAIARQEKSLRYRLRARVGTRLPWRREIEEREGSPDDRATAA
jgi:hypothetical protein